jgi:hypothetical protein
MPAAISPTMIAATTQSTTMQNGGHQRVLATKWVRCCQRSLSPCPARPATSSHGDPLTGGGGHDDEGEGHAALDGDDLRASVGDGEADVDGGDHDEPERVDRRAVQPPDEQGVAACATPTAMPHSMAARFARGEASAAAAAS